MGYDTRVALKKGQIVNIIQSHSDNKYCVKICEEIGRGGSCIVYRGIQKDLWIGDEEIPEDKAQIIIKEFYPKALDGILKSTEEGMLDTSEIGDLFERYKEKFCKGQAKHFVFANDNSESALVPSIFFGDSQEVGTFFAAFFPQQGKTLDALDREELTIIQALELCISICDAIGKVHEGGKTTEYKSTSNLYLDCKPDNIFVINNHAVLFDFDTVQPYGNINYCSCSGWSAPEQIFDGEEGYKNIRLIGFHTDIFSIGAVLYYLLTGKNPSEDGIEGLKKIYESFAMEDISLKDETGALKYEPFITDLSILIKSLLQPEAEVRKKEYGEKTATKTVQSKLRNLITDAKKAKTVDIKETVETSRQQIEETIIKQSADIQTVLKKVSNQLNGNDSKTNSEIKGESIKEQLANRFLYNAGTVDFTGRREELEYLLKFCRENDQLLSWIGIGGEGGSGKTRLVYELCKELNKEGWNVFYPSSAKIIIKKLEKQIIGSSLDQDTIICFDDAVIDTDKIVDFISLCLETISTTHKIRIVLLDRYIWDSTIKYSNVEICRYRVDSTTIDIVDGFLKIGKTDQMDVFSIMEDYALKNYNKDLSEKDKEKLYNALDEIDFLTRPLFALFVCDAWCNGNELRHWNRKEALSIAAVREYDRIRTLVGEEYLQQSKREKVFNAIRFIILITSIFGQIKSSEIMNLILSVTGVEVDDSFYWISERIGIYEADFYKKAFPDILSEYISIDYFNNLSKDKAFMFVEHILKDKNNWKAIYNYSKSISIDFRDLLIGPSNMSVFQIIAFEVEWRAFQSFWFRKNIWNFPKPPDRIFDLFCKYMYIDSKVEHIKNNNPDKYYVYQYSSPMAKLYSYGDLGALIISFKEEGRDDLIELLENSFYKAFESIAKLPIYVSEKRIKHKAIPLGYLYGVYKGEVVFGNRCGKGNYESKYELYEGEWNLDQPGGKGKMIFEDITYEGEIYLGMRHGTGKLIFDDGGVFEGNWSYDRCYGYGVYTDGQGKRIEGEWHQYHGEIYTYDENHKTISITSPLPNADQD